MPTADAAPPLEAAYSWPEGRCVRVNFVSSIDGAATLDGRSGGLSSPADKRVFHHLRATCDVVLVGAGTARREQYRPGRVPVAVVTNQLSLNVDDRLFSPIDGSARPLVLTSSTASHDRREALGHVAEVVAVGQDVVDLRLAVAELEHRGFNRILCEGGPTLFGALIAADLVDELCLTIAPMLLVGDAPRIAHGSTPATTVKARLLQTLEDDGELLLRYAVG